MDNYKDTTQSLAEFCVKLKTKAPEGKLKVTPGILSKNVNPNSNQLIDIPAYRINNITIVLSRHVAKNHANTKEFFFEALENPKKYQVYEHISSGSFVLGYSKTYSPNDDTHICTKNRSDSYQEAEKIDAHYFQAAEQGDSEAQYELGSRYEAGQDVEQDFHKAAWWYRKAAEQGYAPAQFSLGNLYDLGNGVIQDYQIAVDWYTKAAEQGHAQAQANLSACYQYGIGVEQSTDLAMQWYIKAAESGLASAQYDLGMCYKNALGVREDRHRAMEWFAKAAEQGHVEAQKELGDCYYHGLGVGQDYDRAEEWYIKAAEQGNLDAQCALGDYYYSGQGLRQDYQKAAKWLAKAAEQGYAYAQCYIGICYEYGRGIGQDYREAVKWYAKAAEQGNANAQNNLGVCYRYGRGVAQDYQKAVEWYTKAAEQGHDIAQCNLGICYENGRGVGQDYQKAAEWYTESARQGYARAQNNLGVCYEYGRGVGQDYQKAVEWYTKAAEQGHDIAQCNLGVCYEYGQGVGQDYQKAAEWYTKSAKQGNEKARTNLESLYENGYVQRPTANGLLQNRNTRETRAAETDRHINMESAAEKYVNYSYAYSREESYPLVRFPQKDCIVWPYRKKTIARRGYSEEGFEAKLRKYLPAEVAVLGNVNILPQSGVRPYEPDIALIVESELNVRIDIEIDEPYAAVTNKPIHFIGCGDEYRDASLNNIGWIVVRFAERQVAEQPLQCLRIIANLLIGMGAIKEMPNALQNVGSLKAVKCWTQIEAQNMAMEKYREQYLGHNFGLTFESEYQNEDMVLTNEEKSLLGKVRHMTFRPSKQTESAGEEDCVRTNSVSYNASNGNPRDSHIAFDTAVHIYTIDNIRYKAVSNVISEFFPVFDKEKWSRIKAQQRGVTAEQILEEWDCKGCEAREVGTFMHEQIENFYLGNPVSEKYHFRYSKEFVHKDHVVDIANCELRYFGHFVQNNPMTPYRSEWRIYDKSAMIAGTIDMICRNGDGYDIYDWKRSSRILRSNPFERGIGPLRHLEDTALNHYSIQQNLYKYILEHSYGMKINHMYLVALHPDLGDYKKIAVADMQKEIKDILKTL